jgi:hypothetical protein
VQAAYILAREFGWTPQQVLSLTMLQISMYLQIFTEESENRRE